MDREQELHLQRLLGNWKLTPLTMAMELNSSYIPAKFLEYISVKIATTVAKGGGRLIISLPPRHGKSELVTKNLPIWFLENFGKRNAILCSYGAELSNDFGRKVRDIIQSNSDKLDIRIRADAQRVNNWLTQYDGAMMSVGIGGPITGRGADLLVIDDYVKDIKEALSQTTRDSTWDWFITTAYTRLEPGATCIIVATRWHHDDLIGRILKNFPGMWENIVIPALAEPPKGQEFDFLGRRAGEALFPRRFTQKDLEGMKVVLGSFHFNALYQQRPENDMGRLTNRDWISVIDNPPIIRPENPLTIMRVWDLAATEEGGDYMVGSLVAYDKLWDIFYILDVKRDQFSPFGVERSVRETAEQDGKGVPIRIEREPGSSGKLLVHNYAMTILKGWTVEEIPANDQKLIRAQPFLAAAEAGRVRLLKAPWNEAWLKEYDDFPGGDHDDQVDTAAAGYTALTGKKFLRAAWGQDVDKAIEGEIIEPQGRKYGIFDPQFPSDLVEVDETNSGLIGFKPPKVTSMAWGQD
jgi:predicted phage terminase large subunit-like protein